ncbi:MAG: GntR family transcriptional regulator [Mesosutterella sp.]|nr:GntR family transcriptional regulator [Mesosutterella sp.]
MAKKELLWVQLARDIAHSIAVGRYPVGSFLPKELDICRQRGLSRHTVRAALDQLQRSGIIERTPHVGTRVISQGASRGFAYHLSSFRDIDKLSNTHSREICQARRIIVNRELAAHTGAEIGSRWIRLTNIRRGAKTDEPPIVCTQVYIPEKWEDILAVAQREPNTLVAALINRLHGVVCKEVKQDISAVEMPAEQAMWLRCPAGCPALRIRRLYLDEMGRPLEISVSWHPGDRYSFSLNFNQNEL